MTRPIRHNAGPSSEQGFVIVAVLWLLAALAALATIFSVYLSNSARALAVNDTALQAQALVSAGVELTAYQLQLAGEDARPARLAPGLSTWGVGIFGCARRMRGWCAPKQMAVLVEDLETRVAVGQLDEIRTVAPGLVDQVHAG